jgi:hypothetical protein
MVAVNPNKDFSASSNAYWLEMGGGTTYVLSQGVPDDSGHTLSPPSSCNVGTQCYASLSVNASGTSFTLSGTVTAGTTGGFIGSVATIVATCSTPTPAPGACLTANAAKFPYLFTEATNIPPPTGITGPGIPFNPGQIIQVTATITFAPGT